MLGRGVFLGGQQAPTARGGNQVLLIWGVPFYLCIQPLMQNHHISQNNTDGERACFRGQSPQGDRALALPNFGASFYLCVHLLKV